MPKKSSAARSGAQRHKSRAQKSFELVHPRLEVPAEEVPEIQEVAETPEELQAVPEPAQSNVSTATKVKTAKSSRKAAAPTRVQEEKEPEEKDEEAVVTDLAVSTPSKRSASARLAARRQAAQRLQQRNAASLITAEHFAYVRRDLITIAILAVIMFSAIIILYFTIGRA